jgi:flavodoxin
LQYNVEKEGSAMKSLVVYSSQTNNTRKLAQAAYDSLTGAKEIHKVEDAPAPDGFDLVVVGFWLKGGKPDPQSAEFIGKIGKSEVFLFATHGAAADSDHAKKAMDYARSLAASARVLGTFNCPGEVDPAILDKVRAKQPPPPWLKDVAKAAGRPNDQDLAEFKAAFRTAAGPAAVG